MVSSSTPGQDNEEEERKNLRFFPRRRKKQREPSLEDCQEATESFLSEEQDGSLTVDDLMDFQCMWESSIAGDLDTTEKNEADPPKSEVEPKKEPLLVSHQSYSSLPEFFVDF